MNRESRKAFWTVQAEMSKQQFFPTSSSPQFACSAWQSTSYYAAPVFLCNLNKKSVMVCDLQGHFWTAVFSPVATSYLGLKITISLKQITSWVYNTLQQVHWKWSDGRSSLAYLNCHVHEGGSWDQETLGCSPQRKSFFLSFISRYTDLEL